LKRLGNEVFVLHHSVAHSGLIHIVRRQAIVGEFHSLSQSDTRTVLSMASVDETHTYLGSLSEHLVSKATASRDLFSEHSRHR
jgi:hypothetical protein